MGKKGLGKGLDALFWDNAESTAKLQQSVKISEIEPNSQQPRRDFQPEALSELAESIKIHGVIQPLAVRKLAEGRYQIIAGERRWRAAREAGLTEVPVIIVEADDREVTELALVENLQREDLNPIEEAEGFLALINEYSLTQEEAAARVGRSRSAIANSLRLLSLATPVRELLVNGSLSTGHAKTLLSLNEEDQCVAAKAVVDNDLSVRQTETLVKKILQSKLDDKKKAKSQIAVNYLEELERKLATRLGRKVRLVSGRKKGRIELEYYGTDDLEHLIGILETIK